jgi:hypothetical protein
MARVEAERVASLQGSKERVREADLPDDSDDRSNKAIAADSDAEQSSDGETIAFQKPRRSTRIQEKQSTAIVPSSSKSDRPIKPVRRSIRDS